jgi:hypothetical protein
MNYLTAITEVFAFLWLLNFIFGSYETVVFQSLAGIGLFTDIADKFRAADSEKGQSKYQSEKETEKLLLD